MWFFLSPAANSSLVGPFLACFYYLPLVGLSISLGGYFLVVWDLAALHDYLLLLLDICHIFCILVGSVEFNVG